MATTKAKAADEGDGGSIFQSVDTFLGGCSLLSDLLRQTRVRRTNHELTKRREMGYWRMPAAAFDSCCRGYGSSRSAIGCEGNDF